MDWSSAETEKGTVDHERPQSSLLPVDSSVDQISSKLTSPDTDLGGSSSTMQIVSGSPTVTQVDKENGPTVSETDDDKLSGDCPTTTIAISAPESASSQSGMGNADDTPTEEVCDREDGWQITIEDAADEVIQDTTPQSNQSVWDNEAGSDRPLLPSCAEEIEMRSGHEEEMSVVEVTSTNSGDMLPDHDQDQSEAAGQCQGDSAMEESQTPHNQDAESAVESEPPEMQTEAESSHSDSAVSLLMETDCYDETVEENQNESSCSPYVGENDDDDDSDDDDDVITLLEEDFNMPCFVISNVRSVTDDGIYVDEEEEGDTGIYTTAEHQSDSAESPITGKKPQDCLTEVSSNIQPQKPAHEETDTENRPSGHCQEPPSSPPVFPTSVPIQQASSHAVQNTAESGTEPGDDTVRSSTPSSKNPEGNAAEASDTTNSSSSELVTETAEQEENSSTDREGPSSSRHQRRKDCGDRESLVVKLEVEDTGYDTGPAVPSVPDSAAQRATSTTVTLGASSTRRRRHSEVETDPEGDKTDGPKRRAVEVSCSEEGGSVLHVPEEGNSGSAEDPQAGQAGAGTAADTADRPSSQASGQPLRTVLLNTLSKPFVLPSKLVIKKGTTLSPSKVTRRVVLTIPVSVGGKTTSAVQLVEGPCQKTSSQTESSVSSDVAKHSVTQPPMLTHCSSTASGSSKPHTAQRTYEGQSVRLGSFLNHPITMQAKSTNGFVSLLPSVKSNENPVKHPGIPKAEKSSHQTQTVQTLLTSFRSGSEPANSSTTVPQTQVSTTQKSWPTQKVQSLLTSFSCASVPANSSTTVPQTPVSTSQKSAPTIVRLGSQQAVAPKQDVVRTSQSAVRGTEAVPVNRAVSDPTPSSADTGTKTTHAVIVQNIAATNACQTVTPSKAVIIQAIAPSNACDTTTSNIRVDQVSAGAKLAADDMSLLIEGKNLVPSPDILPRPGKSKSLNSMYRCVECSVIFSTLVGYTTHVKRMSMVIRYACMACEAALVFFNKCTFLAHIRKHTTGRVLSLKSNMMSVSSLPRELLPPVEVQFMSPIYTSRTQPLKCTECDKMFPLPSSIAAHFSAVEMCTFEHTCEHCGMELPTACALKAHLRLHDANRLHTLCASAPYVCPECGVQYAHQLSLYQHLFATCLHFNRCIGLHCFACTDSFPTLKTLEDHIYVGHQNNKRYRCLKCKILYKNSKAFIDHIPEMHTGEDEAWSRTESSCIYCAGEWMDGRSHARYHVESVKKPTQFSFACQFCTNCRFLHSRQLLVHLNQNHAAYKFTCTICKQGFVTLSLLRMHILSCHSMKHPKDPNSTVEIKISCRVCAATTLHSDSALPHIMWHVVKKITDVTDSEETLTDHGNKQSMVCVVPASLKDTTKGYLCRMCGHVCSSPMDLHHHMRKGKKSACSQFPACPYCVCYSRDKVTRYRCSTTCLGDGDREGADQGSREKRPLDKMSSEPPQDDDNDSNSKVGSELDEQTQADSSGQNTQQPTENSTPSGNSNQVKRRLPHSYIVIHVLDENKEKGALSSSSRQPADSRLTGSTVRDGSVQKEATSSGAGGCPSLVLRDKSATSLLSGQLSPGGSNTSTCSDLSEWSAADKSGGEMKERETSAELPYQGNILFCRKRKLKGSRETDFDFSATPEDAEEADSQPLYHPCHLCGLTYASADQLASHRASVHRGEKTVLSCPVCQKKGKTLMLSKNNLKRHLTRKHNLAKPIAETMAAKEASQAAHKHSSGTEVSSQPTPGDDTVKRLRIAEDDQQEYVCAKCQFSSPSMSEFRGHIAVHAVENSVQCLECGLCFSAVRSLKKHLFMVHKVKQPDAYIAEHDIKLEALPEDLASEMDTLAPFTQSEVVIRKAGMFIEGFLRPQPFSQAPPERPESMEKSSSNMLECTVCYRDFESEALLRSHMRTHGMAFIRSRRALPRQEGGETRAEERGDMADLRDQQTECIQVD